jgi:hypothetical protein
LLEESGVEGLVVRGKKEIEIVLNEESFVLYVLRLFGKRRLLDLTDMASLALKEEMDEEGW